MSEERTEAPTPKRRQDARDEGRIPKSQELSAAVLLLAGGAVLRSAEPKMGASLMAMMGRGLASAGTGPLDEQSAAALVRDAAWQGVSAVGPVLAALAGTALAIGALQGRGVFSLQALGPKWERVNPLANGRRMLGAQPWVELAKSLLKMLLVGMAVRGVLADAWPQLLQLPQKSPTALLEAIRLHAHKVLTTAGLTFLGLAAADYLYQLWNFERSLRMTREEIKQEMKQSEGDPLLRARMRSMGRALVRKQMFAEVPKADVVITNPTHIAVALRYDPEIAPAPMVIAIGQRKVAERIKAIAREAGVPTYENRPLARALLASAQVGTTIPPELYVAVAEVLAFVIRQRGPRGGRR
ncbi:MAG: EscU/YscU/HrcU family type III secretion system export apparatus switch protein [Gemmatimonadetes bacterium]|nr:EscU/YscU/HrcU family type III secretion system export apparatus switch protein [Gemmatimonadota bacterium]